MKFLKKSEIAIYIIAIMLVTAGYFNYKLFLDKAETKEISSEIEENIIETANIGDAVLVSNSELEKDETKEEKNSEDKTENYYAESKLERDKMYAEMIKNYENILNNENASEVQKSIATQEIININKLKNSIMICENLICTKGFNNCIIFVNQESVNVIANTSEGLNQENVAKLQNIVARELEVELNKIHITEK